MKTSLPIESKPEILQEYGRAFACINLLERSINSILQTGTGYGNPDSKLDNMSLGQKNRTFSKIYTRKLGRGIMGAE